LLASLISFSQLPAQQQPLASSIDAYLAPYVATNNFAGQVLILRAGRTIYERNIGEADRTARLPTTTDTRFHVASVSMQYTVAATLRLIDMGKLSLDTRVGDIVPSLRGGDRITIRNLLEQTSGISDINSRPDYADILQNAQTPASLVAFVSGDTLLFAPGSRYAHEEHSAFNVLALIIERKTGLDFPGAMQRLFFAPAGMTHSAVDDDSGSCRDAARGYAPDGVSGITSAQSIHWSAKAGNASACTTARDAARYVDAMFHGKVLRVASRALVADTAGPTVGYGWFRRSNSRFKEFAYTMSGRAPGFASFVLYMPREDLTVVALSNIYSSSTSNIGYDIAAIALGLPYQSLVLRSPLLPADSIHVAATRFTFGPDFYQPGATLEFVQKGAELFLRWPSGDQSPLLPLDRDHLIDRAYWEPVNIARGDGGVPLSITYDRFTGSPARK
jgi:CubicO group peptidase (beta-lactamase class C family)